MQLDESADLAGLTQPAQSISEHHNTQSVETTVNIFFYFIKNATYQFPSEHYLGYDGSNLLTAYPWQRLTREATAANTTGFNLLPTQSAVNYYILNIAAVRLEAPQDQLSTISPQMFKNLPLPYYSPPPFLKIGALRIVAIGLLAVVLVAALSIYLGALAFRFSKRSRLKMSWHD
ncbi:MAG: hypothetical protein NWT02_10860 [Opitutales bacterium]|nr:hypothetical protein [Opitutales bacterium]MDP4643710.1 hypothetical protein [Opitutales bacterium]MDP4777451.1 hypothetical protein [Opitutales bacterium]MDP4884167.1 hypothetical protein [Opitutales bacterium]MDP5079508.1 hypothetical protein [Opitutales bacterium]